jgi:hypothetical protein
MLKIHFCRGAIYSDLARYSAEGSGVLSPGDSTRWAAVFGEGVSTANAEALPVVPLNVE